MLAGFFAIHPREHSRQSPRDHPREVECGHLGKRAPAGRPPPPEPGVPSAAPGGQAGFTLIELLVVLALLALVAGIAFPNLERLYAGAVRSTERAYILDQFASLGRRAMQRGRAYVVVGSGEKNGVRVGFREPDEGRRKSLWPHSPGFAKTHSDPIFPAARAPDVIDLPAGWEISFDEPLVVRANGVCLGAEVTLRHLGEVDVRVRLEAPFCRVPADA